ncbi:hypothetical protein V1463_10595 [Micrococcus yunnanensis]|uniref:hypothetical protein n=1 Tax=Micrococcus yunnanensis TaxID=566027 RepID=UPI00300DE523
MSTAPKHDGVWERRAAAAVEAVYADADLRLEALQLDLLEPREDGTRWTAQQVKDRRTTEAIAAVREGFREMGRTLDRAFAAVGVVASSAARSITDALTATRDDYTLAGPHEGSIP